LVGVEVEEDCGVFMGEFWLVWKDDWFDEFVCYIGVVVVLCFFYRDSFLGVLVVDDGFEGFVCLVPTLVVVHGVVVVDYGGDVFLWEFGEVVDRGVW